MTTSMFIISMKTTLGMNGLTSGFPGELLLMSVAPLRSFLFVSWRSGEVVESGGRERPFYVSFRLVGGRGFCPVLAEQR
jgi:hypothetical protein